MKLTNEKDALLKAFSRFGFADERSLLIAIGTGVLTVREIFQKIRPKEEIEEISENINKNKFFDFARAQTKGIIIDGIDSLLINFGKCCNPIPGDDLIGFVTRGRGVTVHTSACKSLPLLSHESDRLVPVDWNVKSSEQFNVRLKIIGQDYKGWLKDISECISKQNVNITSVDIKVNGAVATAFFIVQIKNKRQLDRLIKKLSFVKSVDKVERVGR